MDAVIEITFRGWARKTEWFIFFVDLRRVSNDNRDSSKAPAHHGYSVYYVQYMKNTYQHHMCVDLIHCASRHNRITFDTLMIAYGASYTNIPNQNVMQYPSLLCMNIDYVCYQDAWYDHCGSAVCHRLEANSCCCCCCCHSSWGRGKWQYQVYTHILHRARRSWPLASKLNNAELLQRNSIRKLLYKTRFCVACLCVRVAISSASREYVFRPILRVDGKFLTNRRKKSGMRYECGNEFLIVFLRLRATTSKWKFF